jgi:hypothetical protein
MPALTRSDSAEITYRRHLLDETGRFVFRITFIRNLRTLKRSIPLFSR